MLSSLLAPHDVPHAAIVSATMAELRTRMGADLVWFGRIGEVSGEGPAGRRLWWSGIWADGHPAAAASVGQLDDRPVASAAHLDLVQPARAWSTSMLTPSPKGFWAHAFARNVYLRHDLHEEHRLLVRDDPQLLGVVAAVWDRRRTGVANRLPQAACEGHARWVQERLRLALRQIASATPRPSGEVIVSPVAGVVYASIPALQWLDDQRAAKLTAAVAHATPVDGHESLGIGIAGAEVQLTHLTGPHGSAWLGRLQPLRPVQAPSQSLLTPSQAEVIDWVLTGLTAPEIAERLQKSVETVRSQIKQAYVRLSVANRLELVRAMEQPQQQS
jgi:DNA-binding CsgD family transcriptional regulator